MQCTIEVTVQVSKSSTTITKRPRQCIYADFIVWSEWKVELYWRIGNTSYLTVTVNDYGNWELSTGAFVNSSADATGEHRNK